jgi:geranylgeranyl diphosphate synthase type II
VALDDFNAFGYFLGTAFQIQDDVLNLVGNRQKYGKEIGGDLLEGKRTLILAHLFKQVTPSEKDRLRAFFGKPRGQRLEREVSWIYELWQRYGSVDYARRAAREFADAAQLEFDRAYAQAKPGADLEFLRALVGYMLSRDL